MKCWVQEHPAERKQVRVQHPSFIPSLPSGSVHHALAPLTLLSDNSNTSSFRIPSLCLETLNAWSVTWEKSLSKGLTLVVLSHGLCDQQKKTETKKRAVWPALSFLCGTRWFWQSSSLLCVVNSRFGGGDGRRPSFVDMLWQWTEIVSGNCLAHCSAGTFTCSLNASTQLPVWLLLLLLLRIRRCPVGIARSQAVLWI